MLVNEAQLAAALPGYKIGSQIGKGAFGVVLRASDRLGREVAVKVMPRAEDDAAATAETEARILHQLRYPHIVEVFDFVPAGDIALIVMELLSPKSLRERLEEDAVSPEWACAAALALAGALEFAHGHGLVHRDVKPLNVLFTATGRLKLTDFGIAKAFGESATMSGTVLGTPTCMAPEQFLGLRPDRTVDVYALGVVVYELLAGRPPFHGVAGTYEALRQFHVETVPPPMAGVHDRLGAVVMRALEKKPARRQQTAAAFAVELARAATTAFGPEWLQRAGLEVVLEPDVQAALTARGRVSVQLAPTAQRVVGWTARTAERQDPRPGAAPPATARPATARPAPTPTRPAPTSAPPAASRPPVVPASPTPAPPVSPVSPLRQGAPAEAPVEAEVEWPESPFGQTSAGSVFETRRRDGLADMATRAGAEPRPRSLVTPPAPEPAPSANSAARRPSIVLNPRDDAEYRRAGRRGAAFVIGLTLVVIALAVLLAMRLR